MISDEHFFAWLDGELGTAEAAAVAATVAADPALRRRADAHRALTTRLGAAFAPIAADQVPERLRAAATPSAEVIDFAARRATARPLSPGLQWAAMAATLVVGLAAGSLINTGPSTPIGSDNGRLVASAGLEQALDTRLASAPANAGPRIGLSFRDAAGDLCRSFIDGAAAGLACHEGGDWRIRGLFQSGEGQQGEFRMAAGPDRRLAELIDATIAGEPLDAAGERSALEALR